MHTFCSINAKNGVFLRADDILVVLYKTISIEEDKNNKSCYQAVAEYIEKMKETAEKNNGEVIMV